MRNMEGESRVQNSIRNVSFGLMVTILNTLVSFVNRTVVVKILGAEVLGLNGLFTDVITVLSLAELGVGMAIIYSLYRPISEGDEKKISQLMSLYRSAYTTIAAVTLMLGGLVTPFIHKLVTKVDYPLSYIRIVFILFVIRTASSYLFSYKISILNADQKQYIASIVRAVVNLITSAVMITILVLTKNYIFYLLVTILNSLISNYVLSRYVDKKYTFINYKDKLEPDEKKEVFSNIKNIFIKRVSGVITSSTDSILISTLVSTIQVGFYSNYVIIFSVVRTLKAQLTSGVAASIGNLSVTESSEYCIKILKRLTYIYFVFAVIMSSGLMAVSKEFITIWIGEEYVMADIIVYVAIFNLFIEICCEPLWQYLEVSGLFKQDKNIGILGSTVNLIVSVLLGIKIGIVGIFLGTVCTQLIQMVLKTRLIFKDKFEHSPKEYYLFWIRMFTGYAILIIVQCFGIRTISTNNVFVDFILKGCISVGIAIVVAILMFARSEELKYCIQLVKGFATKIKK